jgi:hypothetical protein
MVGKIVYRSFWSWWDNLSFSLVNSFMGTLNPFTLVILSSLMWSFTGDAGLFLSNPVFFGVALGAALLGAASFPTTAAAAAMQEKLIDEGTSSFFREWWDCMKQVIWRSLFVSLILAAAGGLLAFSVVFYLTALAAYFPFNLFPVLISAWFYVMILMAQSVLVPLLWREKMPLHHYFLVSFTVTAKNGARMFAVSAVLVLVFLFTCIPLFSRWTAIFTVLTYTGFAQTLNAWTYRYVSGETVENESVKKRRASELLSPFASLFKPKPKPEN